MSKSKNTQTNNQEFLSLCTLVIQSANSLQEFLHEFGFKSLIFFLMVMLKVIKHYGLLQELKTTFNPTWQASS